MADQTPEKQPEKKVVERSTARRRLYFVPGHGTVEATSLANAVRGKRNNPNVRQAKEGDGNR